jgi:hypothetical protein
MKNWSINEWGGVTTVNRPVFSRPFSPTIRP